MNENCDRCGPEVPAAYRVHRQGELFLCRLCASSQWPVLSEQGWTIWPVNELALAPQAVAAPPVPLGHNHGFRNAAR